MWTIIWLTVGILHILFGMYMMFRNNLVFKYRLWVLEKYSLEGHRKLPPFDRMLWQLFKFEWSEYLEK